MTKQEQTALEILHFLEALQDIPSNLPDVVVGYWQEAIEAGTGLNPDWDKAKTSCAYIRAVLARLRVGNRDVMQVDRTQGLVSILLGTIHLAQKDLPAALSFFKQGAGRLRYWGDNALESLSYFGKALTHKEQKNWSGASESLEKALQAILVLPLRDRSDHTKHLQERIRQEMISITEAPINGIEQALPTTRSEPSEHLLPEPILIPILSDIAAGLGIIAEHNAVEHLLLDENYRNGADFGVRVVGDSMKGHGILPGDIAFIRRQPTVELGEIAAVVITTPTESEGVLKQYYCYEEREDLGYWFLKSSNLSSEHLVVVPSDANIDAIKALYTKARQRGKMRNPIKFYENAELIIVGKYVGLVRNI